MKQIITILALMLSASSYASNEKSYERPYVPHGDAPNLFCNTTTLKKAIEVIKQVNGLYELIDKLPGNLKGIVAEEAYFYIEAEGPNVSMHEVIDHLPPSIAAYVDRLESRRY